MIRYGHKCEKTAQRTWFWNNRIHYDLTNSTQLVLCCKYGMWKALVREDSAQWSTKTAQNKWHRRAAVPQPLRPWAGWNFVSLTMSLCGGSLYVTAFISWPGAEIGSREKEKHKGMDNRNQDICCLYFFLCLLDSTVARKKLAEGAKHRMVRSCMPNALSHCLRRWNQFGSVMIKLPFLLYLFTVSQIHLSDRFPSYM